MQVSFTCEDSLIHWVDYEAKGRNQSRSAFLELIVKQAADATGRELQRRARIIQRARRRRR